ncbi:MAG: ABC transporter ATP-binding protein [Bacteroidales bacterium]|nr:ABC transporter ATP-binding protein [Bacteroidales bacterium]
MSEISVKNLTKVYGHGKKQTLALANVAFDVQKGEIFGFLGPNGAGKTTMQRIIATLLRPTSGTVYVKGYDIRNESAKVRSFLGIVPESKGMYDRLTPREIIRFFGKAYGKDGNNLEKRIDEVFDDLGIKKFEDKLCGKLSSGMRQRVLIAKSIIHEPEILLLDEPTLGLDPILAKKVIEIVKEEKEKGNTILYSTHLLNDAEQLCDRVAIINEGKIITIGSTDEIVNNYGSLSDAFYTLVTK